MADNKNWIWLVSSLYLGHLSQQLPTEVSPFCLDINIAWIQIWSSPKQCLIAQRPVLIRGHEVCFHWEITKIIPEISLKPHLIWRFGPQLCTPEKKGVRDIIEGWYSIIISELSSIPFLIWRSTSCSKLMTFVNGSLNIPNALCTKMPTFSWEKSQSFWTARNNSTLDLFVQEDWTKLKLMTLLS